MFYSSDDQLDPIGADDPLQQRLRDVIGWQIGDGSEEVMKLIIARELLGR